MTSYSPLCNPKHDVHVVVPPLEQAIEVARKTLVEKDSANVHSKDEMIRAAYALHYVLHDLLAAIDAQQGTRRSR
ncbi:hypothetical protein [Streptomyces achromogenes]|uniref:hypothetical protein n=1 Tax=Streptomyces achromogenes TaxID=67255 RepID=UPI0034137D2C